MVLLRLEVVFEIEAFAEAFHTTSSVKNALLTSVEGMALRAHIYLEGLFRTPYRKCVPTSADNGRFHILWMNFFFHWLVNRVLSRKAFSLPHGGTTGTNA